MKWHMHWIPVVMSPNLSGLINFLWQKWQRKESRLSAYSQEHEMRKKGEKQTVWMKRKEMKRAFYQRAKEKS